MGDYDNRPDGKQSSLDRRRATPMPAPKPKAPMPANLIPTAADLIDPAGPVATQGLSSAGLLKIADNNVDAIYKKLNNSLGRALSRLDDPPPPRDQPRALALLAGFAETLASIVLTRVGSELVGKFKKTLSEPALDVVKEQFKQASSGGVKRAATLAAPSGEKSELAPTDPTGAANPAATTLLGEFGARMEDRLIGNQAIAKDQLVVAMENVQAIMPAELDSLITALRTYANESELSAWFQTEIAIAWLNFSASISLEERGPGLTAMPAANEIGGAGSPEWRLPHAGFVEIDIDFPEDVRGMDGVALGEIRLSSDGPGTAGILRASVDPSKDRGALARQREGMKQASSFTGVPLELPSFGVPLRTLPVFRRFWLGTNKLNRTPDFVLTPDHKLEVNGGSALLAAVSSGRQARFLELLDENLRESAEIATASRRNEQRSPDKTDEDGRLGPALEAASSYQALSNEMRIGILAANSVTRARDAKDGAAKIVAHVLGDATTERILP